MTDIPGDIPVSEAVRPALSQLGQQITTRLYRAGLELYSALSMSKDGPARERIERAVAELDDAIKDLRHLMLAVVDHYPED